jgi:hypothetical protein
VLLQKIRDGVVGYGREELRPATSTMKLARPTVMNRKASGPKYLLRLPSM